MRTITIETTQFVIIVRKPNQDEGTRKVGLEPLYWDVQSKFLEDEYLNEKVRE